ncbi:ABC-type nitrate/sulfonate/bicarbonate transport system permease component [Microbacterium sp. AG1240]|uniref:ABC transporter permease n=1 Tax=Microbacterium sp. AG1240 TaxID=2183992 RepID=UPI000EAD21FA|nr:ABC transporter permease [Microbacterium sp. AG1240]RKT35618.1 ABC-type nitrate/sulfonate/bicarbonate transport system permease component [Microbacterium sp. AG1240]
MKRPVVYASAEILVPVLVVLLILWFTNTGSSFFLPPLQDVFVAFAGNWLFALVPTELLPSVSRLLSGYVIAIVIGVGAGIVIGKSPRIRRQAAPVIEFARAIPPPALLPFTLIAFGTGDEAKIILIALVCVWPILLNTVDGITGVDSTLKETGASYRITRWDTLLHVDLRAASPQIFAGMRAALPLALIIMVISEMVGATNGVGFFIIQAQRTFAIADMWSGIILLGLLGYLLNLLFTLVERRALAWHHGARATVR